MNTTLAEWLKGEPGRARVFAEERLIVDVAESILARIEERRITKSELAVVLGKSKAYVSQVLDGSRNVTLRTLSNIAFALDCEVEVSLRRKLTAEGWCTAATNLGGSVSTLFALSVDHAAANEWRSATNITAPACEAAA